MEPLPPPLKPHPTIKISGNAHLSHGMTPRIHGINARNDSSHVRYLTWSPPLTHAAKAHPTVKISGNAHLGHGMTSRIHGINARNESSHVRYLTWSPPLSTPSREHPPNAACQKSTFVISEAWGIQ